MTIKSTQKIIKVGDSLAVTLPAKDAKNAGMSVGKRIAFTARLLEEDGDKVKNLDAEYEAFKARYAITLKNLADR